ICRSAYFDKLDSLNAAFRTPNLFAELRFDLCSIPIKAIAKIETPDRLVFTCRKGKFSQQDRIKAYAEALDLGVDYIDLDMDQDQDLLKELTPAILRSGALLILSQHNYKKTPDFIQLVADTHQAFDLGADIAKIIITAREKADLEKIDFLYQHFDDLIAFAMGEMGKLSRVKILNLGAPFTYAAFSEKEQTAPGQLTMQQMINLYQQLNG
ncbi:MAG: type I 3-dehydroquinate dehydratase, partial [Bacteroidales bacterium]|nr:type I 3-dehydroquinate dehydratase [Bacteroidales bacterium]